MKNATIVAIAGCALLGGQAKAAESDTLRQLLAENQNLTSQLEITRRKEQEIASAKLELEGADAVLKRAEESLRRNVRTLEQEAAHFDAQMQRTENNGCPWGGEAEASYAAACNAQMTKLMQWANDLKGQRDGMAEYARRVVAERRQLSGNTLRWAANKKSVDRDLELLAAARANWQRRYNAFVFRSQAYEHLKRIAPGSRLCDQESAGGSDEDLRRAAQCLQRLFDGAR